MLRQDYSDSEWSRNSDAHSRRGGELLDMPVRSRLNRPTLRRGDLDTKKSGWV